MATLLGRELAQAAANIAAESSLELQAVVGGQRVPA
jgi:hypothetical protein